MDEVAAAVGEEEAAAGQEEAAAVEEEAAAVEEEAAAAAVEEGVAKPPKKRVEFAPSVPLELYKRRIALLSLLLDSDSFDNEDADQVLALIKLHHARAREDRRRKIGRNLAAACADLERVVAEREDALQEAMNVSILTHEDELFNFFVQKQAVLVKQLKQMYEIAKK